MEYPRLRWYRFVDNPGKKPFGISDRRSWWENFTILGEFIDIYRRIANKDSFFFQMFGKLSVMFLCSTHGSVYVISGDGIGFCWIYWTESEHEGCNIHEHTLWFQGNISKNKISGVCQGLRPWKAWTSWRNRGWMIREISCENSADQNIRALDLNFILAGFRRFLFSTLSSCPGATFPRSSVRVCQNTLNTSQSIMKMLTFFKWNPCFCWNQHIKSTP